MLRILLVGAGASFSTKDVENGYLAALADQPGVDVKYYALEQRLGLARDWLQKLWRARGKQDQDRPTWADTVYRGSIEAFEMALRYDVDWVFVISGMYFHPDVLELLHRTCLRTALLLTESPYEDEQQARVASLVDVCWTTERTSVPTLRREVYDLDHRRISGNRHTAYLRHAYDPARHAPEAQTLWHDVVFVGTGFEERIALLQAIDWCGIDLGLYGNWSLLGSRHPLRRYVHSGPISNDRAVALYRSAKIGLNLNRSSQGYRRGTSHVLSGESINPRAYELAATGAFQIAEYRAEVRETFGSSVPTFSTAEELQQLLRDALTDETARRTSAQLARELVAPHTFAARAAQVVTDLEAFDDRSLLKKGA